jgi:hypothetical protein
LEISLMNICSKNKSTKIEQRGRLKKLAADFA